MLTFKLCCFYALGSLCSHSQYLCSCAQQVYVFLLWSLSGKQKCMEILQRTFGISIHKILNARLSSKNRAAFFITHYFLGQYWYIIQGIYTTNNYFPSSPTCTLNCVCFTLFVCLCVSRAHTVIQTSSQWAVLWGSDAVLEPLLEVKCVQKCIFLIFSILSWKGFTFVFQWSV